MPEIVLATLNAKYIHASFGLRYLRANLGELRSRAALVEFTVQQRPLEIAEAILEHHPRIVGLGVYVWNVAPTTELVAILKRLRPALVVVLGGPEVSHECAEQRIIQLADATITGEADLAFAKFCRELLARPEPAGRRERVEGEAPAGPLGDFPVSPSAGADPRMSRPRIIAAPLPELSRLVLPYDEYTDDDLAHRLVYVEASRGCPFECEFCLSSLDLPVRAVPLEPLLAAFDRLLERGVRHFKFVDRTFNLNLATGRRILEFFLGRMRPGLFLHFEMIPDRLPVGLREVILRFPPGTLQFEVGVQTFNPAVAAAIHRRQDDVRLEDNLRFLRERTGVHVHADLIVGLPGETLESFAAGFDRLVALGPQEIQVGMLKRLRGTPIVRHDAAEAMIYSPEPPYEILQTRVVDFATMQRLRRFARSWDLVANSGHFNATLPLFWAGAPSPFAEFLRFSDWFHAREGRQHGIALPRLIERVFEFLVQARARDASEVAGALWHDVRRTGQPDLPPSIRPFRPESVSLSRSDTSSGLPRTTRRQARHRGRSAAD